jgi:hypothetical protein
MCAGKDMIATTARFKAFDNILNPKKDTEQGGRRLSRSEIRMNGAVVGGRKSCYLQLVMKCDLDSELKRSPKDVGSLEVRNEIDNELYLDSIDIFEKVEKVVQGEGQEDRADTYKVSLRFGDTPEHLTLYVNSDRSLLAAGPATGGGAAEREEAESAQSNVVIQFGPEADHDAWGKLKQVLLDLTAVRVAYAENVAEIINTPYKSDLDPWLKLVSDWMEPANKKKAELKKNQITKLNQIQKSDNEARCTLNMCAQVHPWAVRGTLHPWTKKKQTTSLPECDHEPKAAGACSACDYIQCEFCKGKCGKDGGLYTGETLLHIVIVQGDHDSAKWLLDRSAMI